MSAAAFEKRLEALHERLRFLQAADQLPDQELDDLEQARQVAFALARAVNGDSEALPAAKEIAQIMRKASN